MSARTASTLLGMPILGARAAAVAGLLSTAAPLSAQARPAAAGAIAASRDLDYVAGVEYADARDRLDVYMPQGTSGAPVLIYFHGGQLLSGEKSEGEALAARIVPQGIGVVSANYRLSPGVMHPAHVQDAAAAVAWVFANIERLGGDANQVFVGGWSSGAYLAVLMAVDSRYLGAHHLTPDRVRGWIPISPFLYVEETAPDRPRTIWGDDPDGWLEASVTPYDRAGVGPTLLIYADGDDAWRREQNDRLSSELRAAGNRDVRLVEVPNRSHTGLVRQLGDADDRIADLVVEFVRAHPAG